MHSRMALRVQAFETERHWSGKKTCQSSPCFVRRLEPVTSLNGSVHTGTNVCLTFSGGHLGGLHELRGASAAGGAGGPPLPRPPRRATPFRFRQAQGQASRCGRPRRHPTGSPLRHATFPEPVGTFMRPPASSRHRHVSALSNIKYMKLDFISIKQNKQNAHFFVYFLHMSYFLEDWSNNRAAPVETKHFLLLFHFII